MSAVQDQENIVIVGAGPVGLTLAIDLAARGVKCVVLEMRAENAPAHPKCNTVSARSMEIFRRFGIADEIRQQGLPADYPCDVVYATRYTRNELGRLPIPSWSERFSGRGHDAGWPTDEPPHRVSQLFLEPVLRAKAASVPHIELRYETELLSLEQDNNQVTLVTRDVASGSENTLRASYVIGCDGGRSVVRHEIGVPLEGDDNLGRIKSIFLKSDSLKEKEQLAPAWMTWVINAEQAGTMVALDGKELFLCHCRIPADVSFDGFDPVEGVCGVTGVDFDFEILAEEDWIARRLVAKKYGKGRVYLAGDAAHNWLPFAGFGMNAGIEDAITLSWRLAAINNGWASEELLASYEAERRPVGEQVSRAAMHLAQNQAPPEIPAALEDDTEEGAGLRAFVGAALVERDGPQFNPIGLNFGVPYEGSDVIISDDEEPPEFGIDLYTPSTVPGCRVPHLIFPDGSSLYDQLGPEFTLIRKNKSLDITIFTKAAQRQGMPLEVLDIPLGDQMPYDRELVLVRPDQRIAWRGDSVPADVGTLIEQVCGVFA
ncbi:MAG: monooxygenase [Rhodobiaceae bacterium]|nr:MAG: monooxygenase [Rhodobiaceae bacterium]